MNHTEQNKIVSFIWNIADDVLRDVYVRGKYRDVILPMTVIRRLDALLEATKDQVLKQKETLDKAKIMDQEFVLRKAAGQAFYNTSKFTLKNLLDNPKQLRQNFENYLDSFSKNVEEIIEKFDFRNQLKKLSNANVLGDLIEKFISPDINLSPEPVYDEEGNVKLPGLDNHGMGFVFEELIRKFNEENNEEAGEHFTPREVIRLMANLVLVPVADQIKDSTYLVYDCACGTGGMLTVAEETLLKISSDHKKKVQIHLFGQEVGPETYAICKADFILKGEGEQADNIKYGSTLSTDAFPSGEFHFMLANPPYGKSWKTDLDRLCGGNKKEIQDPRFIIEHDGDSEYNLVTRSSDGQLMFLVNMISKMKSPKDSPFGSRIATVHNGSSLFTGDAGQGESNIRRWIIENDWLEAIIALPLNMFYNTGIATYIWIVTNKKPDHRKGKVQLINALDWYSPLRKNLGKKNCELTDEHIKLITDTFLKFEEKDNSKIFPNEEFGYWKITVERPLRLKTELDNVNLNKFKKVCEEADELSVYNSIERLAKKIGEGPHNDFNKFYEHFTDDCDEHNVKINAKREKLLKAELAVKDEEAEPVIKKILKDGTIEYEPDTELRDTEQVPLLEEGGIQAFFEGEVLPYVPDAWIDESKTTIGYEIPFTRYFYKYESLRNTKEIADEILKLENETEGLLKNIIGQ
ncbi:MAG: class I SAM-dependent DNA methyltransferase [Ignavibacteria bacterium]|nr:class I SAM-dependent DNA methyltransferase [Ignavibacteria bacterium]